jgi:anti-sigma factor RsiW
MSAADDLELMQHADSELDERTRADVEARLAKSGDDRAKVQSLGQMSELVRSRLELAADDVPARRFDAMWREIDRAIDRAPDRSPAAAPREAASPGLWARFTSWFERYRGHVLTGTVTAGAVAALAIVLRPDARTKTVTRPSAIDVQPAALRVAPEIETLDTPNGEGTVLNIEDEDGNTTVIWVSPADTVEGI